ncbi:MAG: STAS domain-containing protein [Bacteroidota bacterium]|nr:STAS domain-containing protein [Bacteroidota bacterium]
MKSSVKKNHGMSIIHLEGDFLSEVDQEKLRKQVRELVEAGSIHILIDLTHVVHINSCGLGSIVCALTTLRKVGGDLRIVGAGKFVKELLHITQLDSIFRMYSTVEEATTQMQDKVG